MKKPIPCLCENCAQSNDPKMFEYETLLKYQRNNEDTIKCDRWDDLVPVSVEALLAKAESILKEKKPKRQKLPKGIQNFKTVIEENLFYIDKSDLIRDVWEDDDLILLFPRPRRFGKSLNMSMLHYFFEKPEDGASTKHLFNNLNITKWEKFDELQGKFPVIDLSFKDVKGDTWQECYQAIEYYVTLEYRRFAYVKSCLTTGEKEEFESILKGKANPATVAYALRALTTYLHRYHQEKVIVLLDEYDMPIQKIYHKPEEYKKAIKFFGTLLGSLFKGNEVLKKGVITGILRISRESLFSELNNLTVYSLLSPKFTNHFGFTEKEVKAALELFGMAEHFDDVKRWYDGYQFGEYAIYNPWSILSYLKDRILQAYWINTGGDDLVRDLLNEGTVDIFEKMSLLIQKQPIQAYVDENVVFMDILKKPDSVWNFLLFTGYLTVDEKLEGEGSKKYWMKIPNEEVRSFFINNIEQFFVASHLVRPALKASETTINEETLQVKRELETKVEEIVEAREEEARLKNLAKRDKIFISYSHKDISWLEAIQEHLKVLELSGIKVNLWDDTKIKPGMNWQAEIKQAISEAKVAILLVSTSFLASDFVIENELPPLLKAAEKEGATIIPVILKPSRFEKIEALAQFQALNDPKKPLNKLSEDERDELLLALTDRIEELM